MARGAALQGLGAVKIQKRITRRHYGQMVARRFVKGTDKMSGPLWRNRWTNLWTGETMINGQMQWLVAKVCRCDCSFLLCLLTLVGCCLRREYGDRGIVDYASPGRYQANLNEDTVLVQLRYGAEDTRK